MVTLIMLLTIAFVAVCLLLVFMVVITPSQEGGLASAFGGMGGDSFFGTKGAKHVNRFTLFLAVSFLVLAIAINWLNTNRVVESGGGKFIDNPPAEGAPDPNP